MFARPGTVYVYLIYGLHHCLNVVTRPAGEGSAVLVRAAEPLEGIDGPDACRGPGRLTAAFGVDRTFDGADLVTGSELWLRAGGSYPGSHRVRTGPRIGISRAIDRPWRFWIDDERWISRRP
jgi:DNA-3-methyladenine glycosylase